MTAIFQGNPPKRPKVRSERAALRWPRLSLMRVPLAGQIVLANILVLFVLIAGILAFQPAWPVPAQLWLTFAAAFGVCIALSLALATAISATSGMLWGLQGVNALD